MTEPSSQREQLVARLVRSLSAVASKRFGVALGVWGEPGIGKSWATHAIAKRMPFQYLSVPATASHARIAQVLPRATKAPKWVLAQLARLENGESTLQATLASTIVTALTHAAPVTVLLEDLHEAAPEQLELWLAVAALLKSARGVGLLCTSRSAFAGPIAWHRLEGLSRPESDALLETDLQAVLSAEGLQFVYARAQGNPLFTLEIGRYLLRIGCFWSDGRLWHWRAPTAQIIPVTVEALIEQMFDQLDQTQLAVLEARALLGPELVALESIWEVAAGFDSAQFTEARANLERLGLLHGLDFVHPLISEVLLHRLAAPKRELLSRRVFQALHKDQPIQALRFASGLTRAEVWGTLEQALEVARHSGDQALQGQWLSRMAALSDGEEAARFSLEAARCLKNSDLEAAVRLTEAALNHPVTRFDAMFLRVQLLGTLGRTAQAEQELLGLPLEWQQSQRCWEARIQMYHQARHGQQVIALWQQHPEFHQNAQAHVRISVAGWLAFQGRSQEALEIVAPLSSQGTLEPAVECRLLDLQIIVHGQRDDFVTCEALASQGLELALNAQVTPVIPSLYRARARARINQGNLPGATADYQAALEYHIREGHLDAQARLQGLLAENLIHQAEYERAEVMLLEALGILEQSGTLLLLATNKFHLTRLYLEWRPSHGFALAQKYAVEALNHVRALGANSMLQTALFYMINIEAERGRVNQARALSEELSALAATSDSVQDRARAQFVLAMVLEAQGQPEQAVIYFEQARVGYAQIKAMPSAHRIALELARINHDLPSARAHHRWFLENGWLTHARAAERYFPELILTATMPSAVISSPVRFEVLGPVQLYCNHQPVQYRGKKRLEFLLYLLESRAAGRSEASALELLEALYPEVPELEAKKSLKQLAYLLRAKLGTDAIVSTQNGYALGKVSSDLEEFLQTQNPRLWRGAYPPNGLSWNENVRDAVSHALSASLESLIATDPSAAAQLAPILLEMEPYDQRSLALAMQAAQASGDSRLAGRVYREGRQRFAEVGDFIPDSSQEFLTLHGR